MARTRKRRKKNRQIRKANRKAKKLLNKGTNLGQKMTPELFPGGSGLDRTEFSKVDPAQVDFSNINQFLQPSVDEAISFRDDTAGRYDELVGMRRDKLGGLDSAENSALKEQLFRQIDRERQGALRDVGRTSGLGAGSSFAQRRAVGRDFRDNALRADKNLLLTNVDVKRRALGDFEGTVGARQGALGSAADRISSLRGLQATGQQATDQFNANSINNANTFNSSGQFASDQFNAGQQKSELAGKVGAISAGTGLVNDERDRIQADQQREELMAFLRERDENLFNQAQSLFG